MGNFMNNHVYIFTRLINIFKGAFSSRVDLKIILNLLDLNAKEKD